MMQSSKEKIIEKTTYNNPFAFHHFQERLETALPYMLYSAQDKVGLVNEYGLGDEHISLLVRSGLCKNILKTFLIFLSN